MPIGVFDSGLGGLTVLREMQAALPEQAFVYLGDNRNAPYGPRPAGEIFDLTVAACDALFARGCGLVVLACNTASAVALRMMQEVWVPADRRVLGVLVPMIEAVTGQPWDAAGRPHRPRRVMFFGTPATVASGAFTRETHLRATGVEIAEIACPGLVDALERGAEGDAEALVARYAAAGLARMPAPQAVVLGCTHYPLKAAAFAARLPGVEILRQGEIVAASLCDYLARHPRFAEAGTTAYLTTGEPAEVSAAAARFLGRALAFERL